MLTNLYIKHISYVCLTKPQVPIPITPVGIEPIIHSVLHYLNGLISPVNSWWPTRYPITHGSAIEYLMPYIQYPVSSIQFALSETSLDNSLGHFRLSENVIRPLECRSWPAATAMTGGATGVRVCSLFWSVA